MAEFPPQPAANRDAAPPGKRRARPWHRVLGILCTLPLLWVTLTGAALNHTVDWQLDRIRIDHPWLLRAYGMAPSGEPVRISAGRHEVALWDGQVFLDASPLEVAGTLVGAVTDGNGVAVVTDTGVLRLDGSGAVIESLDGVSLPEPPLLATAEENGKVLLKNAAGWHEVDEAWLEFTPRGQISTSPQTPSPIADQASRQRLGRAWSDGGLPASRVLLDLHAGKFLGSFSKYFYDIVALCTLWLCVTGAILFFRKPRRNR